MTLTSPKGGPPPIDPKSDLPENHTPAMARFKRDESAQKAFAHTVRLAEVKAEDFDTVFYLGGTAPMVKGKHVTGFTNGEEEEVKLTQVVPFRVEDELLQLGAVFEKKAN